MWCNKATNLWWITNLFIISLKKRIVTILIYNLPLSVYIKRYYKNAQKFLKHEWNQHQHSRPKTVRNTHLHKYMIYKINKIVKIVIFAGKRCLRMGKFSVERASPLRKRASATYHTHTKKILNRKFPHLYNNNYYIKSFNRKYTNSFTFYDI